MSHGRFSRLRRIRTESGDPTGNKPAPTAAPAKFRIQVVACRSTIGTRSIKAGH